MLADKRVVIDGLAAALFEDDVQSPSDATLGALAVAAIMYKDLEQNNLPLLVSLDSCWREFLSSTDPSYDGLGAFFRQFVKLQFADTLSRES